MIYVLAVIGVGIVAAGTAAIVLAVSALVVAGAVLALLAAAVLFLGGVAKGLWYELTNSWPEEKLERWRKEGHRIG